MENSGVGCENQAWELEKASIVGIRGKMGVIKQFKYVFNREIRWQSTKTLINIHNGTITIYQVCLSQLDIL